MTMKHFLAMFAVAAALLALGITIAYADDEASAPTATTETALTADEMESLADAAGISIAGVLKPAYSQDQRDWRVGEFITVCMGDNEENSDYAKELHGAVKRIVKVSGHPYNRVKALVCIAAIHSIWD